MGASGSNNTAKSLRLVAMANELLAMAGVLDNAEQTTSAAGDARQADPTEDHGVPGDHPLWADLAREHYCSRRRRDKIFGTGTLFGEPAWDILLDLFIAAKEGRRVSVMSACIGAVAPSTTALRWIVTLERDGLLRREDATHDKRRSFIQITPTGYAAMVEYFAATAKTIKTTSLARLDEFERAEQAAESTHGFGGHLVNDDLPMRRARGI